MPILHFYESFVRSLEVVVEKRKRVPIFVLPVKMIPSCSTKLRKYKANRRAEISRTFTANNYSPTNSSINKIPTDNMLYALNLIAFYTP